MNITEGVKISDNGFVFNSKTGDSFSLNPFGLELIKQIEENKDFDLIKNDILKKMAETQAAIYALNSQREALVSNNPERTIRGGNANDLIFALNKLPNNFTKGHTQKRSLDEKQELKVYCTNCGKKRKKDSDKFCSSCGNKF